MRLCLKASALALSLFAAPVLAQPPVGLPPPQVELQQIVTSGADLEVTLNWRDDVTPLPAGVRVKLYDSQGAQMSAVNVVPLAGSQTIWIPGGALPQSTETWPLQRQLVVVEQPSRKILIDQGVSVYDNGPVLPLSPVVPIPLSTGRVCYLQVDSLECHDSEDSGGDEVSLELGVDGYWAHDPVHSGEKYSFSWPIVLCDTCKDYYHQVKFDLWDLDDPGFPLFDPHDHLGSHVENSCSPADKKITFQGSNYTYWLRYVITCYEVTCP